DAGSIFRHLFVGGRRLVAGGSGSALHPAGPVLQRSLRYLPHPVPNCPAATVLPGPGPGVSVTSAVELWALGRDRSAPHHAIWQPAGPRLRALVENRLHRGGSNRRGSSEGAVPRHVAGGERDHA